MRRRAIAYALLSAALFGASTPLAKIFVGSISPLALAGLLYLGSGIGLALWLALRRQAVVVAARDVPWLAGAIIAGGVVGPALLMYGLARTDAASASLLLNLEAVLTAALAWVVFRENVDRRVFAGMGAIGPGRVALPRETPEVRGASRAAMRSCSRRSKGWSPALRTWGWGSRSAGGCPPPARSRRRASSASSAMA